MVTIANLLTEHMDIWTAAESEKKSGRGRASGNAGNVYGVKKLRELILELAVRGKLVAQDPNDEPASELLKRIQAEKAKLIAEGKLKKEKPLAPIGEDEKPFELPKGWEWTTLLNAALVNPRNIAPDDIEASFVPMTLIGSRFNDSHQDEKRLWKDIKQGFTHFAEGDVGVAKITPCFENSKACVFENIKNGVGAGTTELHIVRPLMNTLNPRYVLAYLKSPKFLELGEAKMTGTAGQKRLPKDFVELNPFPLAPLAEQHRIVAKVDELMALCDQLEQQHGNAQEAHETLVSQLLGTLTQSQNAAEFNANWQRIYAHFDVLFTTETSIDALKQTLLQLAVMGKLTNQTNADLSEELNNKLIKNRSLMKLGKGEQANLDLPIKDTECPIDFPNNWVKIRLGKIVEIVGGSQPPKTVFIERPQIGYTRLIQIRDFKSDSYPTYIPSKYANRMFEKDDIMIGRYGPPVFQILRGLSGTYNVALMKADPINEIVSKDFLYYLLSEPRIQNLVIKESERTAGQTGIRKDLLYMFVVGLPPKEEQHRIVAKVDALMALCDQLKTRIQQANQQQQAIADALVAQAVA
ncbi:MAG: restriction endonuclease subunit S [Methylophilus sp.]|nr:restriction endonuclease subunit S [Methylophilus sp.]